MIKFTTDYREKENLKFLVNQLMRRTPKFSGNQMHLAFFDLILMVFVLLNPDKLRVDLPLLLLLALPWLFQWISARMVCAIQLRNNYCDSKREYTVDQDGITMHSSTLDGHINWSSIRESGTAGDFYYLKDDQGGWILCRIHDLSQEDFKILQHLVRQHAGEQAPKAAAVDGPLAVRFHTDFKSTEIQNLLVRKYMLQPRAMLLSGAAYIGAVMLWLLVYIQALTHEDSSMLSLALIIVIMVTVFNLHIWLRSFFRKRLQPLLPADSPDYIVTTEGVTRFSGDTHKTYFWSQITGSGLDGDIYYLLAENRLCFCCDRKKLSQEDFEALRALAADHVSRR